MQIEIGVLSEKNNWVHKIIEPSVMKTLTEAAQKEIEDEEMDIA